MGARGWTEKTPAFVGARYDRLARFYGVFEWMYGLPFVGVRRKSVEALELRPGDAVLEVGCGSGLNFPWIEARIGTGGTLLGVDLSRQMLARAAKRARHHGWQNVHLVCGDAAVSAPSRPVHAALFCFSYSTMRDRLAILDAVWQRVEAGGHLVVTDARLREGWPRRLLSALGVWMSDRTLLGNPETDPEADLAALGGPVRAQHIDFRPFGFEYAVCAATKPG